MTIRLLAGDCRDVLATLPDASVHCVVTSPPYWGLRDYGTAQWDGGDPNCDHGAAYRERRNADRQSGVDGGVPGSERDPPRSTCGKCGATRVDRQIGLEATPADYLETMVAVFRQVRRVLRPDGTLWLNIGDSYNNFRTQKGPGQAVHGRDDLRGKPDPLSGGRGWSGLKEKDLLLMPARLALALQADGWWVRSDIIWHKPNPMPESVTDRPTSAHEHVFLLTKSARYFFDQDAIREPHTDGTHSRGGEKTNGRDPLIKSGHWNTLPPTENPAGRSCRNVWTIATAPFSQSHFATFPPALVERCIRAGTSERGCCAQCGAPWRRVVERGDLVPTRKNHDRRAYGVVVDAPDANDAGRNRARDGHRGNMAYETTTTGWAPSCECEARCLRMGCRSSGTAPLLIDGVCPRCGTGGQETTVPCTVLDPFFGAGTTGLVADRLGRDAIGIDLNPDYNAMSRARITDDAPLFAQFPVADPDEARQADLWQEPVAK